MDVSPKQMVSVAAALIPFLEHDDANRALMGSNMQRQAVPLVRAEAPLVGTGMEYRRRATPATSWRERAACRRGGRRRLSSRVATRTTADQVGRRHLPADKFQRSNQGTCINQKPRGEGRRPVKRGRQVIADGPVDRRGELALGKNLLVAFMPWEGYNFEDAIILSERLVQGRRLHLDPHRGARGRRPRHQARPGGDHPRHPERLRGGAEDLDERGIVRIGAEVARRHPGRQGHAEGRDRADAGGAAARDLRREGREVRDTSLKVPHGETGKVIGVRVFTARTATSCPRASTSWSASTWPRSARSRTATSSPAATATRASSPRSCRSRTCRSWRTAPRSTSSSTRSVCRAG
jgi:DNA-directed RNA polymerase subunit beta